MTNSFSGGFDLGCIASPDAKIGQQTVGTSTFFQLSKEKDDVQKKITITKKRICALNTQYDKIIYSRKTAEGELNNLVRA